MIVATDDGVDGVRVETTDGVGAGGAGGGGVPSATEALAGTGSGSGTVTGIVFSVFDGDLSTTRTSSGVEVAGGRAAEAGGTASAAARGTAGD